MAGSSPSTWGVLAYFGYPQAHEHDADRAVRAGLVLVEAIPKLETVTDRNVALSVRLPTSQHPCRGRLARPRPGAGDVCRAVGVQSISSKIYGRRDT
jgi:hypothetical protein